ncbi:DUF1015 domain-containing protein [Thermotoga sp. KOL6]|uniref:DUF1015 domain-containing protein n=1 Tax=Thermotoga sp. KOL6 TaxID=126741 RepID=UPI000C76B814|nr:DUF1015 family protein [Thermotoga sp. KOL6]PLV60240.1 hypothetical protein AS005_02820 [Thermotoga sp. KOL6]
MEIKPFRGFRPRKDVAKDFVAKPYDVISFLEAKETIRNNPISFLRVTRIEAEIHEIEMDPTPEDMEKARKNLEDFIEKGILVQEEKEAFYIYRQKMGDHVQTGLVALFPVEEYKKGRIKRHELTRKKKEEERVQHILRTKAHTGQVFLFYRSLNDLDEKLKRLSESLEPLYRIVDDLDVVHEFFVVLDDEEIRKIKKLFDEIDELYIADGHHRAAAAVRVSDILDAEIGKGPHNYFMATVFPHNQLRIFDYNRVVRTHYKPAELLEKVKEKFEVYRSYVLPARPSKEHEITMYTGDKKWYTLTPKKIPKDTVESLDVNILQKELLEPVFGISNPREDDRIDFIGGIKGLCELERIVDRGEFDVAFALYPVNIETLMRVSDEGKTMPPKSTWFEPKLLSGLVVHVFG